jgi:hypothetical protein
MLVITRPISPMKLCLQDVPNAINGLLDTLPGKVDIQGLPFQAVFTYALYTLNYVMLKVRGGLSEEADLGSCGV